jgi:hypothetical protein
VSTHPPGPVPARYCDVEPDLPNAVPFPAGAVGPGGAVRTAATAGVIVGLQVPDFPQPWADMLAGD